MYYRKLPSCDWSVVGLNMSWQKYWAFPVHHFDLVWKRTGAYHQTLEKVCRGFGITLSQFFAEGDDAIFLTQAQKEMLDHWSVLNPKQREVVTELLKNMTVGGFCNLIPG